MTSTVIEILYIYEVFAFLHSTYTSYDKAKTKKSTTCFSTTIIKMQSIIPHRWRDAQWRVWWCVVSWSVNSPSPHAGKETPKTELRQIYWFHNSGPISAGWGHWVRLRSIEQSAWLMAESAAHPLKTWFAFWISAHLLSASIPLSDVFSQLWHGGVAELPLTREWCFSRIQNLLLRKYAFFT